MQSLAAKLIELDLIRKVTSHYILNMFADRRLEVVLVDLGQVFGACCKKTNKYMVVVRYLYLCVVLVAYKRI